MNPDGALNLWHLVASLLGLAANAAATLPLMAALTLVLGRRGHAGFCLLGAKALAGLALWLCLAWPLLVVGDALAQLSLGGSAPVMTRLSAFFTPAGLGISLSVALWFLGLLCVGYGRHACIEKMALASPGAESYSALAVAVPLAALLLGAGCDLAAFGIRNWPFAGLPAGMDWARVAAAVGKHAFRAYFAALCAGGAVSLLLACGRLRRGMAQGSFTEAEAAGAVRWCAVFAVAGLLPQLLERWGLALGLWLRGGASALPGEPQASLLQMPGLLLLTLALAAWTAMLIARAPLRRLALAPLGFALLLLGVSARWVLALLLP